MISALLKYAEDRGLASRPGFGKKQVRWVLDFSSDGSKFLGLIPSDREFDQAPDLSQPQLVAKAGWPNSTGAHFLIAPLSTFIGRVKETGEAMDEHGKGQRVSLWVEDDKEALRRKTEVELFRNAGYESLATVLESEGFVDTAVAQLLTRTPSPKHTDLATIRVGGEYPVDSPAWHDWWISFLQGLGNKGKSEGEGSFVCYGTGELVTPESTHPKLTRLTGVGLSQPHAPIVTFDKEAFSSYGLSQGENAAMGAETSKAYVTALDHLLDESVIFQWRRSKSKSAPPYELSRENVKLAGARVIYWYTGPAEARGQVESSSNLLAEFFGTVDQSTPPEEDVDQSGIAEDRIRKAIERVKTGANAASLGAIRFATALLAGAGGRVMLRDFTEGTVLSLADAADSWLDDLNLVTWWGGKAKPPSIEAVLTAPLPSKKPDQDYLKWVVPASAWRNQTWQAAIRGLAFPVAPVMKALREHTSTVLRGDLTNDDSAGFARQRSQLRLAIVKAYLIRKGIPMTPALDPEHPSAAYHCGRLLAVFDNLQRSALGDVGAGVVQRFYGGALTNPSGVFAQLSRLAMAHLSKLGGGLEFEKKREIADIHDRIGGYPAALNLDEQALFALGFWHQTAEANRQIAANSAAKKAREAGHDRNNNEPEN